ncbi:SgcJ/EcaC family oxidoreductase, partial [Bradyrhizobium erythrophlei]|uniref:SgcJ/EcaC family oxidoreductase n=1 Tax=Bradyrhizobium erythrophlei TaxID=1437360 RepID=UPI0035E5060A
MHHEITASTQFRIGIALEISALFQDFSSFLSRHRRPGGLQLHGTSNREPMMTRIAISLLGLVLVCLPAASLSAGAEDENALRDVETRWQDVWNSHDMKALAALFTPDADFINVNGHFWKGREEIEKNHAATHTMMFKESLWTTLDTSIRFLAPEVALVHVKWALRGDKNPDGSLRQPREGFFTHIFIKRGGSWLISAAHNTNIIYPPGVPTSQNTNLPTKRS